jgi:ParB family chromosome partitioning protein
MARHALGKGLSALIREPEAPPPPPPAPVALGAPREVDIDLIDPSPYQPRTRFREQALEELAQSIRSTGVIQPVVLRPIGSRYQLIAGERRWRAAQRVGLHRVPAVLREATEEQALEMTLVENLQREDLNPLEQAGAFERLISRFHLTQEEVASRTGKDRATIANSIRLLKLDPPILAMLEEGRITAGHGRALLAVEDTQRRLALARKAAAGSITVRQLERLTTLRRTNRAEKAPEQGMDPNTRAAIEDLERDLGTHVILKARTKRRPGQLIIEYYDDQQLSDIYERLRKR